MGSDILQYIYNFLYDNFTLYYLYIVILSSLVAVLSVTYLQRSNMTNDKKLEEVCLY